jgi:hypothetical protein
LTRASGNKEGLKLLYFLWSCGYKIIKASQLISKEFTLTPTIMPSIFKGFAFGLCILVICQKSQKEVSNSFAFWAT